MKTPKYGTLEWRAYQYQRMKEENRGKNFAYWNDKFDEMVDSGVWELHNFGEDIFGSKYSTSSMLTAKEIAEDYRKKGYFSRVVAGREQNRQRQKMFSVIFKTKPVQIEVGEWYYKGCFIQQQDHPSLDKYVVFKDDDPQTHVGTCGTKTDAKILCEQNEVKQPKNGLSAFR